MNTKEIQGELYKRKPRLYRVALELSKFDDPYKAIDMLLALVGSTQEKEDNHDEQRPEKGTYFRHNGTE